MTSSCFQTCPVMTAVKFKSTPTVRLPVVHALMATLDNSIVTCASKAADALLAPLTPARPPTHPRLCVWRWLTVAVSSLETTRPTRPETRPGLTAGSGEDLGSARTVTGYRELAWCQLYRHWWHCRCSAISDDKVGIMATRFLVFHWRFDL